MDLYFEKNDKFVYTIAPFIVYQIFEIDTDENIIKIRNLHNNQIGEKSIAFANMCFKYNMWKKVNLNSQPNITFNNLMITQ